MRLQDPHVAPVGQGVQGRLAYHARLAFAHHLLALEDELPHSQLAALPFHLYFADLPNALALLDCLVCLN